MNDLILHFRKDEMVACKLSDNFELADFLQIVILLLFNKLLMDDISNFGEVVHYILIEGDVFLVFGYITQLVLNVIAYPGEFALHCIVLVAEFGPSFCEEL